MTTASGIGGALASQALTALTPWPTLRAETPA